MLVDLIPLLRKLSEAPGVSGYENAVRQIVVQEFEPYADEVRTDVMGNVIARKRGQDPNAPTIMLAAHMDEIGLMVMSLEDGFIRVRSVGGFDARVLVGQEVMVHGRRDLPGIIGSRPPHVVAPDERNKPIPLTELLIDVGVPSEALDRLVRVGDLITLRRPMVELQSGLVTGKAFDNRASVATLAACLEALASMRHAASVYAVATVQEEVGLKGAITSAYDLRPDLAIAIDVTFGRQPGTPEERTFELGKGPTISRGPNFHPRITQKLFDTAKELEVPVQTELAARVGGTDAVALQISREGIPTGLVSLPIRNMHTPVETIAIKDIDRAARLLAGLVRRVDTDFVDSLPFDLGLDEGN
jgi:putative aminopeptidase FrvX